MAKEKVREAVEIPNAAKSAIAKQCGHGKALSDNSPHSNSGDSNSATDDTGCKK